MSNFGRKCPMSDHYFKHCIFRLPWCGIYSIPQASWESLTTFTLYIDCCIRVFTANFVALILVPMMFWALVTCLLFSNIIGWMLRFFPATFTLDKAMTISQGVAFLIFDTASQILHKVNINCVF